MRAGLVRVCLYSAGVLAMIAAVEGHLVAGGAVTVPEIGGASISAGLGLLAAGILMLRARRRSK